MTTTLSLKPLHVTGHSNRRDFRWIDVNRCCGKMFRTQVNPHGGGRCPRFGNSKRYLLLSKSLARVHFEAVGERGRTLGTSAHAQEG